MGSAANIRVARHFCNSRRRSTTTIAARSVGLKLYNLMAINTERDIQRNVASPDFGMRYDPVPRDFSVVCVFLLGHR